MGGGEGKEGGGGGGQSGERLYHVSDRTECKAGYVPDTLPGCVMSNNRSRRQRVEGRNPTARQLRSMRSRRRDR